MQAELKRACVRAGIKLGVGLCLVVAVLGIRVLSVTPRGLDESLDPLDRFERELEAETGDAPAEGPAASPRSPEPSLAVRPELPAAREAGRDAAAAGRMVSCRLASGDRFMSAGDCATRGGIARAL